MLIYKPHVTRFPSYTATSGDRKKKNQEKKKKEKKKGLIISFFEQFLLVIVDTMYLDVTGGSFDSFPFILIHFF